ncbi:hypothetical protein P700755_001436 [Psychroflexus torquis ATCC 700755]|uniref:Uncharacterized protein n=1 Tax=Psychroflexus torquis (strain ATCC 700755 / CIP 106069 / ACAM 623) TaxID=313595 RepID=K4IS93_PSYTT|nr:hypothetical protein P700755_001436 [Psychroflexus torquis ATCC 700755]
MRNFYLFKKYLNFGIEQKKEFKRLRNFHFFGKQKPNKNCGIKHKTELKKLEKLMKM